MSDYVPNTSDLTHREVRLCERIEFLEKLEIQQRHALDAATADLAAAVALLGEAAYLLRQIPARIGSDVDDPTLHLPGDTWERIKRLAGFSGWLIEHIDPSAIYLKRDGSRTTDAWEARSFETERECEDAIRHLPMPPDWHAVSHGFEGKAAAFAARRGGTTT